MLKKDFRVKGVWLASPSQYEIWDERLKWETGEIEHSFLKNSIHQIFQCKSLRDFIWQLPTILLNCQKSLAIRDSRDETHTKKNKKSRVMFELMVWQHLRIHLPFSRRTRAWKKWRKKRMREIEEAEMKIFSWIVDYIYTKLFALLPKRP